MTFYIILIFLFSLAWTIAFVFIPIKKLIERRRRKINETANNAKCTLCNMPYSRHDIIDENLAGDGIVNSGKTRKILVTMRCSYCKHENSFAIYTHYRHHTVNGSPAQQYFKELEMANQLNNDNVLTSD